ncbi:hypothetical protein JYU34_008702 [Plutella xylostella]|uniref:Uncharacterized protein n=1 Tax=Plutella xylostella TaxID=51655 RepID=A0ABQ7QLK7_PLUXY|nr:hypothetical protein JYU34_008702 [Plutella xylostella]
MKGAPEGRCSAELANVDFVVIAHAFLCLPACPARPARPACPASPAGRYPSPRLQKCTPYPTSEHC